MQIQTLLFATTNPGKLRELAQVLEPLGFEVTSLDAVPGTFPEPVEDQATFAGNARLKAVHYARLTGLDCVAEDSGLEVDALGGAPGVLSACYAGVEGPRELRDAANNAKLLQELRGVPEGRRSARFVCAICVARPDGTVVVETSGTYEGVIAGSLQGENGFGYDPLFGVPELGRTSAQLSPAEKNARSHRGAAARRLAEWFRRREGAPGGTK